MQTTSDTYGEKGGKKKKKTNPGALLNYLFARVCKGQDKTIWTKGDNLFRGVLS